MAALGNGAGKDIISEPISFVELKKYTHSLKFSEVHCTTLGFGTRLHIIRNDRSYRLLRGRSRPRLLRISAALSLACILSHADSPPLHVLLQM